MSIRVSQRQMYSSFVGQMNKNLSDLMESNLQGSSEKRINRPSDDPAGMARVLMYRSSLNDIDRYKKNVNTATGWLGLADSTLLQVSEALIEIKGKLENGANGPLSLEQRAALAQDLRQQLSKLIQLANTKFENQHIFGGHKNNIPAFVEGLHATCNDSEFANTEFRVTGGAKNTTLVQFTQDGTVGAGEMTFRFSQDGGATWQDGVTTGNGTIIDAGGARLEITPTVPPQQISAVDPGNVNETNNGTWMYIRPTAIYQGDDHDTQIVQSYGTSVRGTADGYFTRDVSMRVDSVAAGVISYSYSVDDGANWIQGTAPDQGAATRIPVQGGFINLDGSPAAGDQFIVHPRRAEIRLEISPNETIAVNSVGKDIFGGLYQAPFSGSAQPVFGGDGRNLFETLGRAIAYAETNSQQGLQECLAEISECSKVVVTKATEIGGRENRLTVAGYSLSMRELSETDNMSKIEDIDVTVLMTKLAQQQLAYNTVLKSSSMIMQMNLTNFL